MTRLSLLLILLIGTACLTSSAGCDRPSVAETAGSPASAPSPPRVTAAPLTRKTLELHTVQPGRIEAFETTPLYSRIIGYVDAVLVDIGDSVEQGQVLVRLSVPELEDELQQREALLAQAAAEIRQAQAAVRAAEAARDTAQARVTHARAGIERADAEADRWRAEHQRIRDLAGRGSVSEKLVDETLNQYRATEAARQEVAAEVESARAVVRQAEANVAKAEADQRAAEARQQVAVSNRAHAQTMLAYAEIKAPFHGVVTRRHVDTGHYVQPTNGDSRPLLVVARTDRVRISVDVPESEAAMVEVGAPAVVSVQALRGGQVEGTVTRTSWALDPANRSLRTETELPNENGLLRPGMYAAAQIRLARRENVLTLPAAAITRQGREAFCSRVQDGRIVHTAVELGLRSGDDIEILFGLDEGATVVLLRGDSLPDGQPVEVLPPGA